MALREDNLPTIPSLMKSFMELESILTILEVPDFKDFFSGYIAKGDETLEGHTKAQQFKFFVDSNRCPMMKY